MLWFNNVVGNYIYRANDFESRPVEAGGFGSKTSRSLSSDMVKFLGLPFHFGSGHFDFASVLSPALIS